MAGTGGGRNARARSEAGSPLVDPPAPRPFAWGDLRELLQNVRRTLRLVASVDRALLAREVLSHAVLAGTSVAMAWIGKQIIDAVVASAAHQRPASGALRWVGAELALALGLAAVEQYRAYNATVLRARLGLRVNLLILDKARDVAYPRFEDPGFMNRMAQARREASARPLSVVTSLLNVFGGALTLAGFGALLSSLGAWSLAALLVSAVPPFWFETRFGRKQYELQKARTQRNRQAFYLEAVLTTESTAREVKLFALGRWLVDRYRAIHDAFHEEESALGRARALSLLAVRSLSHLVFYAVFFAVVSRAVGGEITLGAMTLYLTVFRQGQQTLTSALGAVARIYEDNLYMANLFEFLAEPEDDVEEPIPADAALPDAPPELRFDHVTFRYPGSAREVLRDVTLTLRAGETVAVVGRNGAGKTTLVKLLTGLYAPTEGSITLDGVDVRELGPQRLRRQVGLILQDFARFQFSAADNIGVGWLPAREDPASLRQAVADAGAEAVVDRLPQGLDTPLGRAFGGDDLSVGQWQRVALARAFMRRSRVLVLDEPTAAMDAEAEHEVFQRLRDLKHGRTALLITHRFSTVRMADRIVVVDEGRVVEEGTHAELLALGGRYARMFNLQAEGYRDAEAP